MPASRSGRPAGYSGCVNASSGVVQVHGGSPRAPKITLPFQPQIARKSAAHIGSVSARRR